MNSTEKETLLDQLYHEVLENLNKVYSHALLRAAPSLRENLSLAANSVKKLRELKEQQP